MSDPYEPPATPQAASHMPLVEPKSIKVFGVLHLVFGVVGLLGIVSSIASFFIGDWLAKLEYGEDEKLYEMQRELQKELFLPTVIAAVISVVVTFFILRAGIKLLKSKKDAVKASATYSLVSVIAKGLNLILALAYTIPVTNAHYDRVLGEMGEGAGASVMAFTKTTTAVMSTLSPVLMCGYPILCWFLLRRKTVTDYLSQFGK